MAALLAIVVLALVLGFAAHRASVCAVRAVAEVANARTFYMLASVVKSSLWVVLVGLLLFLLRPEAVSAGGWSLTATAVLGGLAFGLGAGFNGACAYSTMARLVDGQGGMLATVGGFALGIAAFAGLDEAGLPLRPQPTPALARELAEAAPSMVLLMLVGLLTLAAAWEAWRLWRRRPAGAGLRGLILARQYRLSTAALLIGLSAAVLFLLVGPSGYSSTFGLVIESLLGTREPPTAGRWLVLVAVLAGMALSTWQRRSFRLDWRPRRSWLRNLLGGGLMGFGVALTPGGNDALVLYALPTLSPHGLPAVVAMLGGIFLGLAAARALFGFEMRVACRDDLFLSDAAAPSPSPSAAGSSPAA